jgi:leucyl aminopeptidase
VTLTGLEGAAACADRRRQGVAEFGYRAAAQGGDRGRARGAAAPRQAHGVPEPRRRRAGRRRQAIAEGLVLAAFSGDVYKSGERSRRRSSRRWSFGTATMRAQAAVERGRVLGESCNLARELCNEPPNVLTPSVFAERGADIGRERGCTSRSWTKRDRAAPDGPAARRRPWQRRAAPRARAALHRRHAAAGPVLGLVGKGITFDTGGISIKPAEGMDRMKDDMAGGAAVIGAMRAISLLKAPITVVGIVPMTENMPAAGR